MSNHTNPPSVKPSAQLPATPDFTLASICPELLNASLVPIADGVLPQADNVKNVFVIAGVPGSGYKAVVQRTFGYGWPDGLYSISGTEDLAFITNKPALAYQYLQSLVRRENMILTEIAVRPLAEACHQALANQEVRNLAAFEDCCENHQSGIGYLGSVSDSALITNVSAGGRPLALVSKGRVTYISDDAHQDPSFGFLSSRSILLPSIPVAPLFQIGMDDPAQGVDIIDAPAALPLTPKARSGKRKDG